MGFKNFMVKLKIERKKNNIVCKNKFLFYVICIINGFLGEEGNVEGDRKWG